MGGCQNYGPFLDPYYTTAPNIWGTQKGTIISTITHIGLGVREGGLINKSLSPIVFSHTLGLHVYK